MSYISFIRRPRLQQGERVRGEITSSKGQEVSTSSKGKKQETRNKKQEAITSNKRQEARNKKPGSNKKKKKTRNKKQEAITSNKRQEARNKKPGSNKKKKKRKKTKKVQKVTLGTGGRGPQARSVLQGPAVFWCGEGAVCGAWRLEDSSDS